jgi:hypothetical protein
MGPEERITYYSNNFGYSHLNPSSHNGITNTIAQKEKNLPLIPSNPKFINNNAGFFLAEKPAGTPDDTPIKSKPLLVKTLRINGVDV